MYGTRRTDSKDGEDATVVKQLKDYWQRRDLLSGPKYSFIEMFAIISLTIHG